MYMAIWHHNRESKELATCKSLMFLGDNLSEEINVGDVNI